MRDFVTKFSPWGRTSRSHYWLIILAWALLLLAILRAKDVVGPVVCVVATLAMELVVLVATIRRLHDAGRSRWWVLLYWFPMTITWDLFRVQVGASTWQFLDVSAAITLIPILIGLLAAPRSGTVDSAIVQTDPIGR